MIWIALGACVAIVIVLLCVVAFMVSPAQAADPRSPFDFSPLTFGWVLLISILGGGVNYNSNVRKGRARFHLAEFIGEMFTSAFVGLLTFWLCQGGGVPEMLQPVFVGISGHMGSRAIFKIQHYIDARTPAMLSPPEREPEK